MGNFHSSEKKDLHSMLKKCQTETHFTPQDISTYYHQFLEEFPSGHITQHEFIKKMIQKYNDENIAEFAEQLFRCYDINENGEIDFREFLITMEITSVGSIEQRLEWVFRLYDIDGNGELSNFEITKILKSFLKIHSPEEEDCQTIAEDWARDIFSYLDKGDTGGDDVMSFSEFSNGAMKTDVFKRLLITTGTKIEDEEAEG